MSSEILINSYLVSSNTQVTPYEFVLNENMNVLECVRIDSLNDKRIKPINDASKSLDGMLFELNHVRVNPKTDNSHIINKLTSALENIGVRVFNRPGHKDMASCFKPMGEITDNVRFYLNEHNKMIFLSPSARPKLIAINNDNFIQKKQE
jgi:hypothetical protein